MEMFNLMAKEQLSPNQFYLMYCIRESIAAKNINLHLDLRALEIGDWIKMEANEDNNSLPILQPKAMSLLAQVESFFKVQKKKTSTQILGKEFADNIAAYNQLFPRRKGGSGKYLRSNVKNVEANFRWFFENYSYGWPTILAATERYLVNQEMQNFKYARTSMYFIRKQDQSRINSSDLADYCEMHESGEDTDGPQIFTEKVV